MSVRFVALLAVAASFTLAPSNASAFGHLFGGHGAKGCDACAVEPSCGCETAAPSCGCEIAPSCGCEVTCCEDPCAKKHGLGLLAKLKAKMASRDCCDPCAAPSCGCEVAPSCGCEVAPSCGCEVSCCEDPCAKKHGLGLLAKLKAKKAARDCCDPCAAPSCGCEIAPSCACGH